MGIDNVSISAPSSTTAPTVTTGTAGSITASGATISTSSVTADGGSAITERGIVYATTSNPTTSNSKVTASGTTGNFDSTLTGLAASTTYYVRAYAKNSVGTTYGSEVSFTTASASSPTISATGSFSALSTFTGTDSVPSSISVSGTALTADITATRPSADFEVSSNNSTWGSTATFTQSGGSASGTLYVRIASGAAVASPSGNVTLTSTGAATVNAAVSGTVYKVDPTAHVTNFATGTITSANIPLTWTAATGSPDGYLIRVSSTTVTDPIDGTAVADDTSLSDGVAAFNVTSGATTSYSSFTGFVAGTTYTFKIYPYNNSGSNIRYRTDATVPSVTGLLLPAAPATPTFSSVSSSGFTVNWSAVTGATNYQLDLATDSGFTSMVSGYGNFTTGNVTSQAVTGLSANITYHARLRAVNSTGTSASSTSASQTTSQLSAPTTAAATSVTSTGFNANWSAVTGATGYRLDVYSGSSSVQSLYSANFTSFTGIGFASSPSAGQLDSDDWKITGWTDGNSTFGGSSTSGDFARGAHTGGASTGGVYAFTVETGNVAFGVQPGGGDWAPGTIVLRVQNTTGSTLTSLDVSYKIWVRNDQARSSSFNFSHSADDSTYMSVGALDYTSTAAADGTPAWVSVDRSTTMTGLSIANNGYYYLRWSGADVGGSGSRDEFALDDVSVTSTVSTLTYLPSFENLDVGNVTTYAVTGASASTEYSYVVRATSTSSTSVNSDVRTVTTTATPSITINSGTSATATAFATTYGTASANQSFTIAGSDLSADISVAAVTGFEYSIDGGSTYGSTATLTNSGGSASGTLLVRLAATAAVSGSYNSQSIDLSSAGATTCSISTAASSNTVSQKAVTISGLSASNKTYDGNTTVSVTGTPAYSGLENGETIAVTGSVSWAFPDANAGNNKVLNRTGSYNAPSANYALTQPILTANITQATPSITTPPTASTITSGQALSDSTLSGGTASIAGSFAFTSPGTVPSPGISSQDVTFTPTDTGNYTTQTTSVDVGVLCEAPVLSRASAPQSTGFTVNWAAVTGAGNYTVLHSASKNMTSATSADTSSTSLALTGLSEGIRFIQVRANNAAGASANSTTQVNQLQSIAAGATKYVSLASAPSAQTVAGIFGSANESGLAAGATDSVATTILLLNSNGSTANTIFYDTDVNEWREGPTDRGNTAITAGKAFILKNNTGSTDYFLLVGTPRDSQPVVSLSSAGNFTLLTTGRTAETPLTSLNLNPGTGAGQFKASSKPSGGDRLIVPPANSTDPATTYWYHAASGQWYDGLTPVPSAGIPAGQGFFIKRASDSTFDSWTMPAE